MSFTIRLLTAADAAAFRELRLEALLAHPEAFGGDYETEKARELAKWQERLEKQVFLAAEQDGRLVGMIGFVREDGVKVRHSGRIISVYVKPEMRGRKLAETLMNAIMDTARQQVEQVFISVSTINLAACRLYQRCGFTTYGTEPRALKVAEQYYDEYLMVKDLRS